VDHRYASDLISRRKTAAPRENFKRDRPPSYAGNGDRGASRDRQEDRCVEALGDRVILNREIDHLSFSLRCYNMLTVTVSGKIATIFFWSSCFFAAGSVSQLALDIFYPSRRAVLNELRLSDPAMSLEIVVFGTGLFGLVLFMFGIISFFASTFGFKRRFARIHSLIVNLTVHAVGSVGLFLIETWQRKFPTRDR
jgi:hypothetical protein